MVETGRSFRAIAEHLGVATATIRRSAARSGVRSRHDVRRAPELRDRRWLTERYVEAGRSMVSIARELDVNVATVRAALDRFGLRRAPVLRVDRTDALRLIDEGLTAAEIAAQLGCSTTTVWRIAHQSGRRPSNGRLPQLDDALWLRHEHVSRGRTTVDIAAGLGVSAGSVRTALQRAGVKPRGPRQRQRPPKRELLKRLERHRTFAGVARSYGVAWGTVEAWFAEIGVFHSTTPRAPRRGLERALRQHGSTAGAARQLGVTADVVRVERIRHRI